MIRAYWLRIVICAIGGVLLGWFVAIVTPKKYDAIVQVLLDTKQYVPSRTVTNAEESVTDLLEFGRARSVETQVELLTSYGIIVTASQRVLNSVTNLDSTARNELEPVTLQERVSVSATTESDIVTLRVRLSRADLAEAVADEIYNAFYEKNAQNAARGAEMAIRQLTTQLEILTKDMTETDREVATLQAQLRSANIEYQSQQLIQYLSELYGAKTALEAQFVGLKARLAEVRRSLRATPKKVLNTEVTSANALRQVFEKDLAEARTARRELLTRYLEDHDSIKQIDERIANIEKELREAKPRFETEKQEIINPLWSGLENERLTLEASYAETVQRQRSYDESIVEFEQKLRELPGISEKMNAALRRQYVLERNYTTYMDRLESLKASQSGRTAIPGLVTEAVAFPRAASPNMTLNLTLGLFLGLVFGILWSISTESRNSPIRTIGQLNRLSLQPVFRQIPELRRPVRGVELPPAEVFESLLVNFVRSGKKGYRLGVVGVNLGTGATVTSINLAIAAVRGGYSVLLVEGDPRLPIERRIGQDVEKAADGTWSAHEGVRVIPNFVEARMPTSALTLPDEIIKAGLDRDLIVLDFMPATHASDAILYAADLDEILLIVHAGITKTVDYLQVQQALVEAGAKQVTVVFARSTGVSEDVPFLERGPDDTMALGS